jgi:uncharacterized RDD family membrane protein YckC
LAAPAPTIRRRLACVLYECLLLLSILFVSAFPFVGLAQGLPPDAFKILLRLYLVVVTGVYFSLFWHRGQTLAMKTWGIRIESARGGPPSIRQAWLRYLMCWLTLPLLGMGWWSALRSPDRQFLQDRLAGTRLTQV